MFKKLFNRFIPFILLFALVKPIQAQRVNVSLSYQSFRPFIHFQLNFDNNSHRSYRKGYRSAYLKGYMDGVNNSRYLRHRFASMVHDFRMYETGYQDGFRDRELLIHMRGRPWYCQHRFSYDDYYAPVYSVRSWLSNLSMAFIQAPSRKLPQHWRRRARPRFKKYRRWYRRSRYYDDDYDDDYDDFDYDDYYDEDDYDDDYRGYSRLKRSHNQRLKQYRRKARRIKKRYRKKSDYRSNKRSRRRRFNSKKEAKHYIKQVRSERKTKPKQNIRGRTTNKRHRSSHQNTKRKRSKQNKEKRIKRTRRRRAKKKEVNQKKRKKSVGQQRKRKRRRRSRSRSRRRSRNND